MKNSMKLDRNNVEEILSLSPTQEAILFQYLTAPQQYVEQLCLSLAGQIDIDAVKQAWRIVAETNEILRTVFRWEGLDHPIQIVLKEHPIPILQLDISHLVIDEQSDGIEQVKMKDRASGIDLQTEPYSNAKSPARITRCVVRRERVESSCCCK